MTITIKLDTGNAAFADGNREAEIVRIVKEAILPILEDGNRGTSSLYDYNGNRVGTVTVTGR